MAKERSLNKLNEADLKEVAGGQTVGEWADEQKRKMAAQQAVQPGPGNQLLVKEGQTNKSPYYETLFCPLCKTTFVADVMQDIVYCPNGHMRVIKG